MPLKSAQQPEIIRSNQKDEYYQGYVRGALADLIQTFCGARTWIKWRKELDVLADVGYFGLTTLAGFQTLGEEYVNIIQVDSTKKAVPSSWTRLLMISLYSLSPYLIDRALQWLQKELRGNPNLHITPDTRERLLQGIASLRHMITIVHRCHLAAFYLRGVFYHIAKRFVSVRYLAVRGDEVRPRHWGYRVLGWLAVTQLTFTFIQGLYRLYKVQVNPKVKSEEINQINLRNTGTDLEEGGGSVSGCQVCSLCLEVRKHTTATPCGHLYCWSCIAEWCSTKPQCPLCRDKFHISRLIYLQNYDPT